MRISSINSVTSFNGINVQGKHIDKDNTSYEKKPKIPELPNVYNVKKSIYDKVISEIEKTKTEIESIWTKTGDLMREELNKSGLSEKLISFSEFADDKNNILSKFLKRMNIKQNSFVVPKEPFTPWNCLALETKDKEFGKQMLDNIRFFKNMDEIISLSKNEDTKMSVSSFRLDYKTIEDIFPNNVDFQKDIYSKLLNAKEQYEKTGRKTVMYIDGIDKLGNPQFNSDENIAKMKYLLQQTHRTFGTQGQFIVSDFKKLDPGLTTSNRMAIKENIDKAGFKKEDIETLENYKKEFDPLIEKIKPIYDKGWEKVHPLFDKLTYLENNIEREYCNVYKSDFETIPQYIQRLRKMGEIYPKVKEMMPIWEEVIKNATGVSLDNVIEPAKEAAPDLSGGVGGSGMPNPNPSGSSSSGEIIKTTKTPLGKILIGAGITGLIAFGAYQYYKDSSEKQDKIKNENKTQFEINNNKTKIKTDDNTTKPLVFAKFG